MASLAANATLDPPVVTTAGVVNSSGIWVGTPGNAQLVLRQNDVGRRIEPREERVDGRARGVQHLGDGFRRGPALAAVRPLPLGFVEGRRIEPGAAGKA